MINVTLFAVLGAILGILVVNCFPTVTVHASTNTTEPDARMTEFEDRRSAPNAQAGSDVKTTEGQKVVLDGSASTDPDGDRLAVRLEISITKELED